MRAIFKNRRQAGLKLAEKIKLSDEEKKHAVLVALPRGGVEVGVEISKALNLPLDVLIVRKVGHPLYSEYGIGAVTEDDFSWLDEDALGIDKIPQASLDELFSRAKKEVSRRKSQYRKDRALIEVENKIVIIVDDGLATGVTARLAARYLRFRDAKKIILAVPVCIGQSEHLKSEFDQVVCLDESSQFGSVGQFFKSFDQLTDEEVIELLSEVQCLHPLASFDVRQFPLVEQLILKNAVALKEKNDFEKIIEKIKNHKIVMLGEATHGTQEFYAIRRWLTKELVEKHGFNIVAVEGDWPACAKVDHYIRSKIKSDQSYEILRSFQRWPTWMWANAEVLKLVQWMKGFNEGKSFRNQIGFYGLDVYSFFDSITEVLNSLQELHPEYAKKLKTYYSCLEQFNQNEKSYAKSLHQSPEGCSKEIAEALRLVLHLKLKRSQAHELFNIQQNARIIKNAEYYFSSIIHGTEDSWNIRDRHMLETLELLLTKQGASAKAIVWAHNSHIGDYRATNMLPAGHVNLGGLAREKWGADQVALIGFGTYRGEVLASRSWDGPAEAIQIPVASSETYELLFHHAANALHSNSLFLWMTQDLQQSELKKVRGHRAIGVVYNPFFERKGNDVSTSLTGRYDGFVFIDQTHALIPLKQKFQVKDIPETWPGGF